MGSHYSKPKLVKTVFLVARGGAVHANSFTTRRGIASFMSVTVQCSVHRLAVAILSIGARTCPALYSPDSSPPKASFRLLLLLSRASVTLRGLSGGMSWGIAKGVVEDPSAYRGGAAGAGAP